VSFVEITVCVNQVPDSAVYPSEIGCGKLNEVGASRRQGLNEPGGPPVTALGNVRANPDEKLPCYAKYIGFRFVEYGAGQ
jgi:hypothetical protein